MEINERESKAVVGMFRAYLEHESLGAVVRWLKREKIPTKRGGEWKTNTVGGILRNRVYLGYYIYDDIVTYHKDLRLISDETFVKVQKKLKERENCGPSKHYDFKMHRFRDQIFWENDTDNDLVQEYLAKKAQMPQCPRCGDNIAVYKRGFEDSPTYGRLQRYQCTPCNYEFIIYPDKPIRTDVDNCPKCKSKEFVRKEGKFKNKSGTMALKYYCNRCRYWFRRSPPTNLDKIRPKCDECGSKKVYSGGKRRFGGKEYQYWECQECGKWWGIEK